MGFGGRAFGMYNEWETGTQVYMECEQYSRTSHNLLTWLSSLYFSPKLTGGCQFQIDSPVSSSLFLPRKTALRVSFHGESAKTVRPGGLLQHKIRRLMFSEYVRPSEQLVDGRAFAEMSPRGCGVRSRILL